MAKLDPYKKPLRVALETWERSPPENTAELLDMYPEEALGYLLTNIRQAIQSPDAMTAGADIYAALMDVLRVISANSESYSARDRLDNIIAACEQWAIQHTY